MTLNSAPLLKLEAVGRTYGASPGVHALSQVGLSVERGQFLTVMGRSGSGKSTLLNILGLMDSPSTGKYSVAGVDTASLTDRRRSRMRAQHFGFVFQRFHLIGHRSALDNVTMGTLYRGYSYRDSVQHGSRALDLVALSNRSDALAATLSGGERQRVAIARAISGSPSVLLCDEPTGNLDSEISAEVVDVLVRLNRDLGLTLIIVTHDPDLGALAPRGLRVQDGRVLEERT